MRYLLIFVASFITFFTLLTVNSTQSFARNPKPEQTQVQRTSRKIVKTSTPTSTPKPTSSPTSSPAPTQQIQLAISKESENNVPVIQEKVVTDVQQYIMNAINDYRKSLGLSTVKTDTYTCDFAKVRAKEIESGFNHNGFKDRINAKTLPYPTFSSVTENLAQTSDYKKVVNLWINSPGHAENMRKDTPYVCVEQNGTYYAYEGWRP